LFKQMIFCFLICKIFFPLRFNIYKRLSILGCSRMTHLSNSTSIFSSRLVVESVIVVEIWEENILQVVQVVILMTLVLFKLQMRVIDLCIMCLWIFRGNQVGLSVQKISKAKGPKMATLIFDEKSKPAMSIIYWQRLRPTSTKNSLGFIKV